MSFNIISVSYKVYIDILVCGAYTMYTYTHVYVCKMYEVCSVVIDQECEEQS